MRNAPPPRWRHREQQLVIVAARHRGADGIDPARRPPGPRARDRSASSVRVDAHARIRWPRPPAAPRRPGRRSSPSPPAPRAPGPSPCPVALAAPAADAGRYSRLLPLVAAAAGLPVCRALASPTPPRPAPIEPLTYNLVARPRAAPGQPLAGADLAAGRDVDDQRAGGAGDVAADDRNPGRSCQGRQAVHDLFDVGGHERTGSTSDSSAHRGVAPIAARSLKLTASALWPMSAGVETGAGEVHPFDDGVGRDDEPFVPAPAPAPPHRRQVQRGPGADGRGRRARIRANRACSPRLRLPVTKESVPLCRVGRIAEPALAGGAAVKTTL